MFGRRITLFKLLGFEVRIDWSWLVLAFLITWSLARGVFPRFYPSLSETTVWIMGGAGALGLFGSIVFHELCHSLVARHYGLPMKGITLFIFGGVAEMEDEPPSAKAELLMALAGPAASVAIGVVFRGLYYGGRAARWPTPAEGVCGYLFIINFVLAGFNMLPAFPLDGGRVFRSVLWMWKHDLRWATRIASAIGSVFGLLLIFLGILYVIGGNFIGGLWWFLIGLFIRHASQMSFQRLLMRQALEGEPVRRFMRTEPVWAPASITLGQLVQDYMYHYHYKVFPVEKEGKLIGSISTREVKAVPREDWEQQLVVDHTVACSPDNTIEADTDATKALATISRTGNSRLLVTEHGELVGILSLKDLMKFLSLKLDLEGHDQV